MQPVILLALALSAYAAPQTLPLPHFIKPCSRNDPNLDQCGLEHAREAIPFIVKGDRKYKIPVLDPFQIKEIKILDEGPRTALLKLIVKDVKITGLRNVQIDSLHFNITEEGLVSDMDAHIDRLEVVAKYDITGNILLLPIRGNGDANITILSPKIKVHTEFDKIEIDGRTHLHLLNFSLPIKASRMLVNLTNLFNGNKLLGDEMNLFINNNWEEVYKEMSPTLLNGFKNVALPLYNNVASRVPYDEVFPETL